MPNQFSDADIDAALPAPNFYMNMGETIHVPSESNGSGYNITRHDGSYKCSCPAWIFHQAGRANWSRTCKHLKRLLGDDYEIARMGLYGFFELPAKAPVKPKTLKVSKNDPYSSYTSADYNIPYVPALSGGPDVSAGVYAPIVDDKKTAEAGNAKLNAVDQDDHDLIDTKPASKKKRGRASKVKAEVVNEEQEEGEGGEDVKPIIRKAAKRAKVAAPRKKAAVVKDPDVDEVKEKAKNSRAARAAARMIVKEESY